MQPSAHLESPEHEFDDDDWGEEDDELVSTDEEEVDLDEYDDLDEDADL
jgi:hypothetical protein